MSSSSGSSSSSSSSSSFSCSSVVDTTPWILSSLGWSSPPSSHLPGCLLPVPTQHRTALVDRQQRVDGRTYGEGRSAQVGGSAVDYTDGSLSLRWGKGGYFLFSADFSIQVVGELNEQVLDKIYHGNEVNNMNNNMNIIYINNNRIVKDLLDSKTSSKPLISVGIDFKGFSCIKDGFVNYSNYSNYLSIYFTQLFNRPGVLDSTKFFFCHDPSSSFSKPPRFLYCWHVHVSVCCVDVDGNVPGCLSFGLVALLDTLQRPLFQWDEKCAWWRRVNADEEEEEKEEEEQDEEEEEQDEEEEEQDEEEEEKEEEEGNQWEKKEDHRIPPQEDETMFTTRPPAQVHCSGFLLHRPYCITFCHLFSNTWVYDPTKSEELVGGANSVLVPRPPPPHVFGSNHVVGGCKTIIPTTNTPLGISRWDFFKMGGEELDGPKVLKGLTGRAQEVIQELDALVNQHILRTTHKHYHFTNK